MEYACAVWHPGLSNKLSKDIQRVQKRCLKIIYPKLSYSEALEKSGRVRLDNRREDITQSTFGQVKCSTHYPFSAPKCKKTRYGRDLIPYCIAKKVLDLLVLCIIINPCLECFHCYVIIIYKKLQTIYLMLYKR